MAEHEKQALTPEEIIARKGNTPRDDATARYGEAAEITSNAYHPTTYPDNERFVRYTVPHTAETPIRGS